MKNISEEVIGLLSRKVENLTKEQYLKVLENIQDEIETRIECVEQEMSEERCDKRRPK